MLGMNSGTSVNSLDMVAVRIVRTDRGVRAKFLTGREKKYPSNLRNLILDLADSDKPDLTHTAHLDNVLGRFYGRAAADFIGQLARQRIRIDVVASHGQTVRHLPEKVKIDQHMVRCTVQLGSLSQVATRTGRITIGDFRQADIAIGNEGAPVTQAAMERLFSSRKESRLIVNVGGMSNYFYLPGPGSKQPSSAADCGPGNSLCDLLCLRLFGKPYDRSGKYAAAGQVSQRLMMLLHGNRFFSGSTVSTGRESFGRVAADKIIKLGRRLSMSNNDMLATAAALTVDSIVALVWPIIQVDPTIKKLYLTGGGRKNIFLIKSLARMLPEVEIDTVDELGIDGDFVEAACFAVMGEAALRSEPLPTTGKIKLPVMGIIAQPPVDR